MIDWLLIFVMADPFTELDTRPFQQLPPANVAKFSMDYYWKHVTDLRALQELSPEFKRGAIEEITNYYCRVSFDWDLVYHLQTGELELRDDDLIFWYGNCRTGRCFDYDRLHRVLTEPLYTGD